MTNSWSDQLAQLAGQLQNQGGGAQVQAAQPLGAPQQPQPQQQQGGGKGMGLGDINTLMSMVKQSGAVNNQAAGGGATGGEGDGTMEALKAASGMGAGAEATGLAGGAEAAGGAAAGAGAGEAAGGAAAAGEGGAGLAALCCFIVAEAEGGLPDTVRRWRDHYYAVAPRVGVGYVRMARWLVPVMRRSPRAIACVRGAMTRPLIRAGLERDAGRRSLAAAIAYFWIAIWWLTGYRNSEAL